MDSFPQTPNDPTKVGHIARACSKKIVSPCSEGLVSRLVLTGLTRLGESKCLYGEKSTRLGGGPGHHRKGVTG